MIILTASTATATTINDTTNKSNNISNNYNNNVIIIKIVMITTIKMKSG